MIRMIQKIRTAKTIVRIYTFPMFICQLIVHKLWPLLYLYRLATFSKQFWVTVCTRRTEKDFHFPYAFRRVNTLVSIQHTTSFLQTDRGKHEWTRGKILQPPSPVCMHARLCVCTVAILVTAFMYNINIVGTHLRCESIC